MMDKVHLLQGLYLAALCLAGWWVWLLFSRHKTKTMKEEEIIFQCNITKGGSYEILMPPNKVLTVRQAKVIIRQVVADMARRDEKLVRILFAESLERLTEDPTVRALYREVTGEELTGRAEKSN